MFRTTLIVFLLTTALCAAQPAIVDVQEIVRKSVAATEANWKEAPGYGIVERDVESQKNEPKTIRTYHVQMIDGSPYRTLIAVNDRPLEKAVELSEDRKLQAAFVSRKNESARELSRRIDAHLKERDHDHAMMRR
jgi:hypothetical protein